MRDGESPIARSCGGWRGGVVGKGISHIEHVRALSGLRKGSGGTSWSCRLAEHVASEPGLDVLPSRWIDATALVAIAVLAVPPALAVSRRPRGKRRSRILAGDLKA